MTSKKNFHTSYDRERGQWKVQRAGGKKADSYHGTAESAWERTRDLAEKSKGEAIKHRKDNGQIHKRNTFGDDPFPPRG